ncbi:MAG: hypothetical protein ACOZE5_01945 [Verrucomicrobiota bacterium]
MSLINEALKKAQRQRTGEAPALGALPTIGGETPRHLAGRSGAPAISGLLLKIGLGAGGLALVVAAGVFLLRGKSPASSTTPAAQPPDRSAPPPAPVVAAPAPAAESKTAQSVAQPAAKSAENAFVLPIAAPSEPAKTAPTLPGSEPRTEAANPVAAAPLTRPQAGPAVPAATSPAKVDTAPPARLEPRAMDFIDSLRVAGIRASATDAKVLMNDRVYRIGDTVEREMGLRLVGITANSLTFEDERGGRYTRNF